jgi:trk system potassium uptake protein TrkA
MRDFCIIGMGQFGQILATKLKALGHTIIGIDIDPAIIEKLKDKFTELYILDATDPNALMAAGVAKVDTVIVAIGDHIEPNILTVQNLIDLEVKDIWARAETQVQERILSKMGVANVFMTERDTAVRLAGMLHNPGIMDIIDILEGYSVARVKVGPKYSGKTLKEIDFRSKFDVMVLAIQRRNKTTPLAGPDDKIYEGDCLLLAGKSEVLGKLKEV